MPAKSREYWSDGDWIGAFVIFSVVVPLAFLLIWYAAAEPSFSVMVDVSVAFGTGALAVAAFYQTYAENKRQQISELNRRQDRTPNFRIQSSTKVIRSTTIAEPGASPPGDLAKASPRVRELEVFLENVGPGIAGDLSVELVTVYAETEITEEDNSLEPELRDLGTLLKRQPKFESSQLPLSSQYLPVGPDNKMLLLNADSSAQLEFDLMGRETEAYILQVKGKDLDGNAAKTILAVIAWFDTPPELIGINDDEFPKPGKWDRAPASLEASLLKLWRASRREAKQPIATA